MQRDLGAGSFENDVVRYGWSRLIDQLQTELEQTVVRGTLVAQETIGCREIEVRVALGRDANIFAVLAVLDIDWPIELVDGDPTLVLLIEVGRGRHHCVAHGTLALGRVSVAEARSASELVIHVQVEESRSALAASTTLHVLFTQTDACIGVTGRCAVQRATNVALALFASLRPEIEVIGFTSVAFLARHAGLALTLAFAVALQCSRA